MKVTFINDWRYLFSKASIGGRFSAFTLIMISYLRTNMNDIDVDGFTFIILGLGFRINFK